MNKKEFSEILDKEPQSIFYFYTPECQYCTQISPLIRSYADDIQEIHFINTFDDDEEISDLFEVEYVPALTVVHETPEGLDFTLYDGPEEIKEFLL